MAGEKLLQKALGVLAKSAPTKVVEDPAERAANLAKAMSRSAIKNTETNEPIRLYHATRQPNLEALKAGGHDPELSGPATWLSPYADKQPAFHNTGGGSNYREGANVMPVYADIQTPLVLDTPEMIDWAQTAFAGGSREFPQYLHPDWRKALIDEGYDGIVYGGPKSKEYALHDLQIGQQPHRDEEILSLFPERQLKSAIGNGGEFNMEVPRLSEAHGGQIDAALHAVRQHRADGGFLSGPDYLSTGEVASPTNWGDPELASDFFKADKALRLAREAQGRSDDVTGSIPLPPRRPIEAAPRQQVAAPPPAPVTERTFRPVTTLPIGDVEPHDFPPVAAPNLVFSQPVYGERTQRLGGDEGQNMAPAVSMDYTLGNAGGLWLSSGNNAQTYAGKVPEDFNEGFGNTMSIDDARQLMMFRPAATPQAAVNRAVSLAQNLAPAQQEAIPSAADALAAVERLHNAGVYSGPELDKAGEILAAHNRAKFNNIPVEEALRLIRAEGPPMVNQGMPREERPAARPMAYAATPVAAPAVDAIDQATGKLTARIPEEPSGIPLTRRQGDLIARTIAAETSGKTPEEGEAIANVILNRIRSGQYGDSPEAVLFAKRQFEPWMNPAGANYPLKISPTGQRYLDAQANLEAALAGEDITRGATHFWGPKAQEALGRNPPSWSYRAPGVDIGETRFHKLERAHGGEVDDALRVVREHHADGEVVGQTTHQRMRDTLASIDPERSRDQPVMDPATMGEAWDRARRNYQNFPVQEGEAVARPLDLSARDVIGGAIAGGAREPGAQFRRGVADLLVGSTGLPDTGTLGFGLADVPMAAGAVLQGSDIAHSLGQGAYDEAAINAALPAAFYARGPLGAAGRRAVEIAKEYAKPAAATAAGVAGATVSPDEAEAAKLSQIAAPMLGKGTVKAGDISVDQALNILKKYAPDPKKDPRFFHNISANKLATPIDEMEAKYKRTEKKTDVPVKDPSDYEGKAFISAFGDPSIGGVKLISVNGQPLTVPTKMQAGPAFMYGAAAKGPDKAIWASDRSVVSGLQNKAAKVAEAGFDPYLNYVKMGGQSPDYSHHVTDPLIDLFRQSSVSKDAVEAFDKKMRTGFHKDFEPYPNWPGLNSPDLESYLFGAGPGKSRTAMAKLMATGEFQKMGMPDVAAVRYAATDPSLLNAINYSSGRMISRMDPNASVILNPKVPHKTYATQLAAHPEGADVSRFSHDIPIEVSYKDWLDKLMAEKPDLEHSNMLYTHVRQAPILYWNAPTVDRVSKFLDLKQRGLIP